MSFKKEHRQETLIYLGLWAMLFIAPVVSLSVRIANTDETFNWSEVLMVWKEFLPFFIVFLIHNHLLATQLIYRQRRWLYIAACILLLVIFHVWQTNHRPNFRQAARQRMEMSRNDKRPPMPRDLEDQGFPGPEGPEPDDPEMPFDEAEDDSLSPLGDSTRVAQYNPRDYRPRPVRGGDRRMEPGRHRREHKVHPPLLFGQHDFVSLVILIMMMGMNVGIKLYFRQRGDRKKMELLEKQNLEQQLEYLKYQINPHFFMNTLNNIHALVDIDPEKAKHTILELSKMMRFVLYEGNKQGVPLDREISFLQNYITLMKLRYTDKVRISVDLPPSLPNREVPPLMFITFVENAFKHGVSYRQESFIDITLEVEGGGLKVDQKLIFTCRNSRIPKEEDKHGGVGLANVRQRLDLIYGDRYTLDIKDEPDTYTVTLTIPI